MNNYKYTEEQVRLAYHTSIIDIVKNYYELKDEGKLFYRVPGYGGLFLSKQGCGYYLFSGEEKGNGIDFLVKYCGFKTKQDAIGEILNHPGVINTVNNTVTSKVKTGKMILPEKEKDCKRVYAYLLSKRCLDKEIVCKLIYEKMIYQESKRGNVVFVGYDKDNIPKYATKRGTCDIAFKGELANSDKKIAFKFGGNDLSTRVYVTESPIDAISHATLMKMNNKSWYQDFHLSFGCTSDRALEHFLKENPKISTIVFCLDNDKDAKINHGQVATAKYIQKYSESGYKCLTQIPKAKDFNEDLVNICHEQAEFRLQSESLEA